MKPPASAIEALLAGTHADPFSLRVLPLSHEQGNPGAVTVENGAAHVILPPLAAIMFEHVG